MAFPKNTASRNSDGWHLCRQDFIQLLWLSQSNANEQMSSLWMQIVLPSLFTERIQAGGTLFFFLFPLFNFFCLLWPQAIA